MNQIWDTSGDPRFESVTPIYLRAAGCVVFFASAVDSNSVDKLDTFYSFCEDALKTDTVFYILLVTKMDLVNEDDSLVKRADDWAKNHHIDRVFHVSSKEYHGFEQFKDFLVEYGERVSFDEDDGHAEPEHDCDGVK